MIIFSAGSITLKGFSSFVTIPENLVPIIISIEIISIAKVRAIKTVAKNIFK